jgi:hypothetical protein
MLLYVNVYYTVNTRYIYVTHTVYTAMACTYICIHMCNVSMYDMRSSTLKYL